ncbi:Major facilitator super domain-containing protein 12 [Datura stramonium]|uniref:Major facilitator super domain-containing protein 12 n=1 Tax=Datura stramonium TaxID=4076 RepID=A0ABS8SYI8_DATST|nr:Major facilitator super domain-containing protein 12 [Datura stramonium]
MTGTSGQDDESKPLGRWSVLAYGVGHVLNDITSTFWYTYLLLYLTSIGLPPRQVASLAITGQFTDATMTIIAGELIDRFGHFKIWHIVGTVLVSVAFSSFYWSVCVPCKIIGIDTPLVQMIGYYIFDILFSGGWSCTQVSHMAMVNGITLDQTSRVACVSCRNAFTMVASLIVYGIGFFVFNSSVSQVDIKEQYHLVATITILIGCCFVIIFHLGTKEPRVKQVSHKTIPRGSSWKRWLKNGLYYRVASIYVLTRVTTNISQVFLALYVISDLHMSQSSKALVPAIIYLCSFITSVLLQELEWSSHKLKAIFSVGGLLWLFCGAVVLSLPINMNIFMYILSVVIGIANAFMMVTSVGMESELVDKEVEGSAFVYGSLGFVEKVLCGIMLYILESYESVTPVSCDPAYPCFTVTRFSLGFIPGIAALAGVIVTVFTNFRTSHPKTLAEPLLA